MIDTATSLLRSGLHRASLLKVRTRRRLIDDRLIDLLASDEKNRRYDLQTAAIIRRAMNDRSFAVDVGAHTGDILEHMVAAAPRIRHLAVEPLPHLAEGLRTRFSHLEVAQVALVADPTGAVEFHHVTSNPAYSGLRVRRYDRPNETVEKIEVPTARLDDLIGNRTPTLIKIDVEGAELGVLQSGSDTIGRSRPLVVFEHGLGASDHYGTTPEDIWDFFHSHDMRVALLPSWLDHGPDLSKAQLNEQFHSGVNYYFIAHP